MNKESSYKGKKEIIKVISAQRGATETTGSTGATGPTVVRTAVFNTITQTQAANSTSSVTVSCPAGTFASDGGALVSSSTGLVSPGADVSSTIPTPNGQGQVPTGWFGAFTFASAGTFTMNAYAICVPITS